jgi:branched-chain amino acid transport system ATP-binding protein
VSPLLECKGVVGGHGSVVAVRDFDLSADAGTVVAVLGPNGAGKTTLLETIAGYLPRIGGEVIVDGKPLKSGRAYAANKEGVVLVPDDRSLFTTLTVRENLELATRKGAPSLDQIGDMFPALANRWKVDVGAVSGGEQQMLAVARALVQNPRVLLLDEMSTGLAPIIVENLLPVVRRIADETHAVVVLVEQHVPLALEVADDAMVLVHGDVLLSGTAKSLAADPSALEAAYMGAKSEPAKG